MSGPAPARLPAGADPSGPDRAAELLERLAAIEAGIHADRHRQPAAVVEEIARLRAAGATVPGSPPGPASPGRSSATGSAGPASTSTFSGISAATSGRCSSGAGPG